MSYYQIIFSFIIIYLICNFFIRNFVTVIYFIAVIGKEVTHIIKITISTINVFAFISFIVKYLAE